MLGLMQAQPLQIATILRFASQAHPRREIVSRVIDEPNWRYDYAGLAARAAKVANALAAMGIGEGDIVSSLAWNTHRHLELFYGVTGLGTVLHTANPRLSDAQLAYTINHAGSTILFYERNMAEQVERVAPLLETVKHFIMLTGLDVHEAGPLNALCYEEWIASKSDTIDWPIFDENAAAFLCYTSGTTGDPKGVLYSHRAVVLHAMGASLASAFGLNSFDVVMPCSSLYHATAWGLPFVAPMCGSKLVLPGDKMDGASLHELISQEGVTFTGGVPTIWTMYLSYLQQTGQRPESLKTVMIGGSAVPRAMAESFKTNFGVETLQLWGMTELCPLGVVASPTPALADLGEEQLQETIWTKQGRVQFGIELKIVDDDGGELPWDGEASGALLVRGPWAIQRYYRQDNDAVDANSWFDTGDVATIDPNGFMRITDRKKDVIKSGGEWISSIDIENVVAGYPGVRTAAVVGIPHPRWDERPLLVVETHEGEAIEPDAIIEFLKPHVAKWWLPDALIFDLVPMTATGKIDKKVLRDLYQTYYSGTSSP